MNVKSSRRL